MLPLRSVNMPGSCYASELNLSLSERVGQELQTLTSRHCVSVRHLLADCILPLVPQYCHVHQKDHGITDVLSSWHRE